jgi:hypothetical protein
LRHYFGENSNLPQQFFCAVRFVKSVKHQQLVYLVGAYAQKLWTWRVDVSKRVSTETALEASSNHLNEKAQVA